ncbi:ABC transporter substrate-binding protein [Desulfogranum mediterraneum]|uniref:ABC transporter substrate-binding protein n=1 Tax=Desulfogranum mediterraneum TaxID=160661 RepID=UPI000424FBED|nr:ABC transporter substrate-binding protein [Desulfogranum mediterraneum]
MNKMITILVTVALAAIFLQPVVHAARQTIKLGFDIPLTGEFTVVGNNAKNVGQMINEQLRKQGGLKVGDISYEVDFVYADNASTPAGASSQVLNLVSAQQVVAIVGPLSSRQAIPAAEVANAFATPIISPWSTSPKTTKNRPFAFRSGYLVDIQAPVLTTFVRKQFGAEKAAVLYDIVDTYPRFMAKDFKRVFEAVSGPGSVVAYEEFRTGDTDFTRQLQRIVASGADVLFTPQHYNEVPSIVRQARKLGWNKPIVGSNSWAGGDLISECGDDCNGLYFVGNYAAGGAVGVSRQFARVYQERYGVLPDEVAGLTWDAVWIMLEAIKNTGGLGNDLVSDRQRIRDQLVSIKDFEGVTGTLSFNASGDPTKCAVMIKISDEGVLTHHETLCP